MKNKPPLLALLCLLYLDGLAQSNNQPLFQPLFPLSDTFPAQVVWQMDGDSVRFSSRLRPLRQLAGAPTSYYTYFWDFGDGAFSFLEKPAHRYADSGTYYVRLYATNYFDDGLAPPSKPFAVKVNKKPTGPRNWMSGFFAATDGNVKLKVNSADHRPGEDFVLLMGYQNKLAENLNGTLVLFFNERQFNRELFALNDKRMFNGEQNSTLNTLASSLKGKNNYAQITAQNQQSTPGLLKNNGSNSLAASASKEEYLPGYEGPPLPEYNASTAKLLKTLKERYVQNTVTRFTNLTKAEEKFMFLTMKTLPTVIQDSNATITITALLVPDDPKLQPEKFDLDMQIAASHDPNRLLLKPHYMSYRFAGKKKQLTYKVQFENIGKGPARRIGVNVAMPKEVNISTLQIKGISPRCTWCDSAYSRQSCIDTTVTSDGVFFSFKNVYLPGIQQNLVTSKDSAQGFIEYTVNLKKRPKKKLPFTTRASIIFDKNEPIITNKATARFLPGFSPGIVAGYTMSLSNGGVSARGPVKIGFTLGPYAPSKPFFQFELYTGLFEREERLTGRDSMINFSEQPYYGDEKRRDTFTVFKRNVLELVPLHFRYNLSNWVGIGVGMMGRVVMTEEQKSEYRRHVTITDASLDFPPWPLPHDTVIVAQSKPITTKSNSFWDGSNIATFVDVQVGMVRTTGISGGLRFIRQWKGNIPNHFFLYAAFRL
ncbi:PKD domain-containing protein [Foetidibacter luteolus]|uniref:PKD domain-containing protein n=1 Tax=Foetidibacter luteolus TaxID=2608880 RepID=UPI00129B8B10|nr:PKD domain-containing protein [Foetidibacter luteolus]